MENIAADLPITSTSSAIIGRNNLAEQIVFVPTVSLRLPVRFRSMDNVESVLDRSYIKTLKSERSPELRCRIALLSDCHQIDMIEIWEQEQSEYHWT